MAVTARPLEGVRVVDLTRALAGPYATLLLATLGAEVIKVEDPRGGDLARDNSPYVGRDGLSIERRHDDDVSVSHLTRARGKHGVSLNMKAEGAREVFADLVRSADIVVENFTAGTADRLGIGYEAAKAVNPRIIYCSLSGFGADDTGGSKAMDVIVQALSGAMFTSGEEGSPPVRIGIPLADMLAPIYAVIGIVSALHQRSQTGISQHVDVSMLGALTSFVAIENWEALAAAGMPSRTGLTVRRLSPFGVFPCRDGYVALVAVQDTLADGLFRAMGQQELASDPLFATRDARVANAPALEDRIGAWLSELDVSEAVDRLEAEGVPVAPVRKPGDAIADERVVRRGEINEVRHPDYPGELSLKTSGLPIRFSGASTGPDPVLPVRIGQHDSQIYGEILGYSDEKIEQLRKAGVIA